MIYGLPLLKWGETLVEETLLRARVITPHHQSRPVHTTGENNIMNARSLLREMLTFDSTFEWKICFKGNTIVGILMRGIHGQNVVHIQEEKAKKIENETS